MKISWLIVKELQVLPKNSNERLITRAIINIVILENPRISKGQKSVQEKFISKNKQIEMKIQDKISIEDVYSDINNYITGVLESFPLGY